MQAVFFRYYRILYSGNKGSFIQVLQTFEYVWRNTIKCAQAMKTVEHRFYSQYYHRNFQGVLCFFFSNNHLAVASLFAICCFDALIPDPR